MMKNKMALYNVKSLFKALFQYFILLICSVIIIFFVDFFIKKMGFGSVMELFSKSKKEVDKKGFWLIIFILPFMEEILFRLHLVVNKINLTITTSLWILILCNNGRLTNLNFYAFSSYFKLFLTLIIGLLFYKFVFNDKVISFFKSNERSLFYLSIALFGLIHITNIKEFHWQLTLLYPFFVLPQFCMGYLIGKLRVENGFLWGFFLHAIINLIGSIMM